MNIYQIEDTLFEIQTSFKKEWKKERISSKLRKKPNSRSKYPFTINVMDGYFTIENGYLHAYFSASKRSKDGAINAVLDYLEAVARAFHLPCINLIFSPPTDAHEFRLTGMRGYKKISEKDPNRSIYSKDKLFMGKSYVFSLHPQFLNTIPYIEELISFLEKEVENHISFTYTRVNTFTNSLYSVSYYHRGHEGIMEIVHDGINLILKDESIQFSAIVSQPSEIYFFAERLLKEAYEQIRLKNLIEPNRKHFDKIVYNEFKIRTILLKEMFQVLNYYMEAELIEEKIINYEFFKSREDDFVITKIFQTYFIFNLYKTKYTLYSFKEDEFEKAKNKFLELVLSEKQANTEDTLHRFVEIEKKKSTM